MDQASARSSTASSSGSNTATSSWISRAAPRRFIRRDELIPRETFRPGDRVRALLYGTCAARPAGRRSSCRARIRSSCRSCFGQEVAGRSTTASSRSAPSPATRGPARQDRRGSRRDSSIRPGFGRLRRGMRGSRVQAVVGELQGEKIDITPLVPRTRRPFIVNVIALQPAERSSRSCSTRTARRIEVVVPDDQLSLAIGRRGQNVAPRLAADGLGDIDIPHGGRESFPSARQKEFQTSRTEHLFHEPTLGRRRGRYGQACFRLNEGFRTVEEIRPTYPDLAEVRLDRGLSTRRTCAAGRSRCRATSIWRRS